MSEFFNLGVSDVIQILILYFVIYAILRYARGSRFGQVLTGVGVLGIVLFAFTFLFHFDVLSRLVQLLLVYLAISTVVIFQPEIRRFLAAVGALRLFDRPRDADVVRGAVTPERLADCVFRLASRKTGALIALERGISLKGFEDSGVRLDAEVSPELLTSIFTPPLPLHDGGIVLRNGRIAAAHCLFPVSNQPALITSGMRHRAAVGLTEETDAVVLVVSEETGKVSVAHNGKLHRYDDAVLHKAVLRWIAKAMPDRVRREDSLAGWISRRARAGRDFLAARYEKEEYPE